MTTLSYEVVDVFTDRPFAGNPLAVVFGAQELARDQLQALAREFHLSETAFVLPPTVDGASYRLRIFTPLAELPFAGHPSVGAAVTQLRRGLLAEGLVHQECGAGVLPVLLHADGRATLTGGTPALGPVVDPSPYVRAAGLSTVDRVSETPVRVASCGLEFTFLHVRPDAVARASATATPGVTEMLLFAWDPQTRTAHARMFAPALGVSEDPATGSAALALGVFLVDAGLLPGDGESRYTVHQGAEVHRPSTLECSVTAEGGQARGASVTGAVMPVARGEISVPPFVG